MSKTKPPRFYVYAPETSYYIQVRDRKPFKQWSESVVCTFPTIGGGSATHYTRSMAVRAARKVAKALND